MIIINMSGLAYIIDPQFPAGMCAIPSHEAFLREQQMYIKTCLFWVGGLSFSKNYAYFVSELP
jgi:hypothetical protein